MGYDLYIHGIELIRDEKKLALMAVRDSCRLAGISEPKEVSEVLDGEKMCSRGKIVGIDVEEVTEPGGDYCQYIDIKKLPHNLRYIRLWHSY